MLFVGDSLVQLMPHVGDKVRMENPMCYLFVGDSLVQLMPHVGDKVRMENPMCYL